MMMVQVAVQQFRQTKEFSSKLLGWSKGILERKLRRTRATMAASVGINRDRGVCQQSSQPVLAHSAFQYVLSSQSLAAAGGGGGYTLALDQEENSQLHAGLHLTIGRGEIPSTQFIACISRVANSYLLTGLYIYTRTKTCYNQGQGRVQPTELDLQLPAACAKGRS